jgi:hypothetical protein
MNIMNMLTGFVTPVIASKVAGALGVPEGMARKVISVAMPLLLGAILKRSTSPGGTEALGSALGSVGSKPLESLGSLIGGEPSQLQGAASSGSDMLGSLLGGGTTGTIVSKLASYAGIDASKAGPLLGLAGSMALGGLKKTADEQGLDAAGVVKLLESQKSEIAGALPADFVGKLEGTDILGPQFLSAARRTPAAAPAAAPRAAPPPPPPARKSGMSRWIIGLIVLALLAWLLSRLMGGGPEETPVAVEPPAEPAAEAPAAEAPAAEPAPEAEAPATDTAAAPANPLEVGGVDLGSTVQGTIDKIIGTLGGVTDVASAEAALPALTEADASLAEVQTAAASLPAEGTTALQALVSGVLPALQSTIDGLLADSAMGPILKPVADGILAKLTALAG